jgi:regulatory protein SWI5
MSISDLNLEPGISASIEETNVTLDDIAQYIEGPMPQDNKWVCRYEDCNKRFGRKENIKSHVQTHLGDRQFRCDHCHKCFVRGHDLKRHAKIHTGSKPYPCACGNTFARHDALTRHRQRGMCIGAFEGVIKKVVKRGRPRKHRPEMDDRLDKAGRTRVKNEGQSPTHMDAYTSSASSCGSMSSWGSPPTENMDNLSIRGNSPFDDVALFGGMSNHSIAMSLSNLDNVGFPPDMFSFTPPASPGYSTGNKPSPSHRSLSPTTDLCDIVNIRPATIQSGASISIMDHSPAMTNAQLQSMAMQNSHSQGGHSLPSLSQTSSSPAPHVDAFDFAEMPHQTTMISQSMPQKLDERNDFDNFLDYGVDMSADPFFTNI